MLKAKEKQRFIIELVNGSGKIQPHAVCVIIFVNSIRIILEKKS